MAARLMLIKVIAMNEGFSGAFRARRFFPNGEEVVLEVLDDDADPPEVTDATTKKLVPDPKRIGKASFEAIKKDMRLKLLSDGAAAGGLSKAAYDAANRSAQEAAAQVAATQIENARLADENKALLERLAALEKGTAPQSTEPATEPASPATKKSAK